MAPNANSVDEDAFFLARRSIPPVLLDEPLESASPSSATPPPSDETSPRRKRRRALPEWVSRSGTSESASPTPQESVQEPDTRTDVPRSRSVSVTPPPDLDEDMREFARRAVENVMRRDQAKVPEADDDFELGAPTSDDVSLDLNADLARYYKGPNAHKLRERAIARERELQALRQKQVEETEVNEILENSPPPANVITIDDSSDDEQPAATSTLRPPTPPAPPVHEDEGDTMSLVLRAAKGSAVPVKVRPTTKMATILAHFVQNADLTADEKANAYLSFEGEVRTQPWLINSVCRPAPQCKTTTWKTTTSSKSCGDALRALVVVPQTRQAERLAVGLVNPVLDQQVDCGSHKGERPPQRIVKGTKPKRHEGNGPRADPEEAHVRQTRGQHLGELNLLWRLALFGNLCILARLQAQVTEHRHNPPRRSAEGMRLARERELLRLDEVQTVCNLV